MKTKTIITTILGLVLMINLINAVDIFAGNNYTFESEEYAYWDVIGNSSNMEGMNITWLAGNITLNFDIRYKSDNFTLIFFNAEKEIIVEVPVGGSSGGSGGSTRTIYKNNTVYLTDNDKYILKEVPIYIDNETIIITREETKENKIWKDYLIVGLVILSLILFIWLMSK